MASGPLGFFTPAQLALAVAGGALLGLCGSALALGRYVEGMSAVPASTSHWQTATARCAHLAFGWLVASSILGRVAVTGPPTRRSSRRVAPSRGQDLERRARALEEQARRSGATELKRRLRALYKLSHGGYLRLLAGAATVAELDQRRITARPRDRARSRGAGGGARGGARARRRAGAPRGKRWPSRSTPARRSRPLEVAAAAGLRLDEGRLERPVAGPIVGGYGVHVAATLGIPVARRGVELHSRSGEPVRAIASGRVRFVGEVPGLGRGVTLDHGDGYVSLLAHLGAIHCAVGDEVDDGETLAEAAGSSVYLELTQAGTPLDPTRWLGAR